MATFPTPDSRYTPALDPQRILLAEELTEIAERAQSFTSASGVMIALKRGNELVVRTSHDIAPEVGSSIPLPSGVTGLCVTTKKPQSSASADAEAQLETAFRALGMRSVLSVPVQWDGEVRGVLAVLSLMPEAFSRTHIAILMTLRDVIASKLRQCEVPPDTPQQAAPAAGQVVELDVDSLLQAPPQTPTPKPAAPVPPKASVVPARPTLAVPAVRVQPATTAPPAQPAPTIARTHVAPVTPVAASTEEKLPAAGPLPLQPAGKPLGQLLKQAAEPPAKMSSDVLAPSEDPNKYSPVQKTKPAVTPVLRAAPIPAVASSPVAPPAMFTAYHAPARSNRKNILLWAGSAAAVVVVGLAIVLYPSHKPSAAPAAASAATQESPAPVAAAMVATTPNSAGEQAPAAASKATASSTATVKHEQGRPVAQQVKPAAPESKPAVEQTAHEVAPVLHVVAARKPAAKAEEPQVEPPAFGLIAAARAPMPTLPTAAGPAPSLAARKSALVPATLVQGKPPQYPPAAKRLGLSGTVKLELTISAEGRVTDLHALSGHPMFRQPSIVAVREWVYRPAHLDGKAVASTAEVSLQFKPGQ